MYRTITLALGTAGALCGMLGGVASTAISPILVDQAERTIKRLDLLFQLLYAPPPALGIAVLVAAMIGAAGTGLCAIGSRRTGAALLIGAALPMAWFAFFHALVIGQLLDVTSYSAYMVTVSWGAALAAPLFLIGGLIALAPPAADAASIKPRT